MNEILGIFMTSEVIFDVANTSQSSKSQFWHLHRVPRVKICIYTNFQLNLIISWHSNTIYEWHFGLSYDIWRHIWRHNHVLTLQKFLNIIIQTSLSVFHPKRSHLYAVWDQHGHFNEISVVLGYFWIIWVILGVHDFTMGSKF